MTPEITNKPLQPTDSTHSPDTIHYIRKRNTLGNNFSSALFYFSILFFFIGFNFSDVMVGNWYQQWMPDLGNNRISDITFVDSLVGYAVTRTNSGYGTNYIL
ncbi:MAG: hypothetical protein K8I03_04610, partial [Ignavibacteria bacterium]|nr:hypothetical protein [Ignavibacteria bacterium]